MPLLDPYLLIDEVGMGIACMTLRLSLQKGRYVGNLQWNSICKAPISWAKLYGAGTLGTGDTILSRNFTETSCSTRGPWFVKLVRGV